MKRLSLILILFFSMISFSAISQPPSGTPYIIIKGTANDAVKLVIDTYSNTQVWVEKAPGSYINETPPTDDRLRINTVFPSSGEVKIHGNMNFFSCSGTKLTSINTDNVTSLLRLGVVNCNLDELDVSKNTSLSELFCGKNDLLYLDLTKNTALRRLICYNNNLLSLDVSKNSNLIHLTCNDNELKYLNVANGNNPNFDAASYGYNAFNAQGNPDLTCIQIDAGFTPPTGSSTPVFNRWKKDATATYQTTSCRPPFKITVEVEPGTTIKLDLKAYVEDSPVWIEDYGYFTRTVGTDWTNFTNYTIEDGYSKFYIYGFLRGFDCQTVSGKILNIDISGNPELKTFFCPDNNLTYLDVSKNKKLEYLYCQNNRLYSLDVSQNQMLKTFDCRNNRLMYLCLNLGDPIMKLKDFNCTSNPDLTCIGTPWFTPAEQSGYTWKKDDGAKYSAGGACALPETLSQITVGTKNYQEEISIDLRGKETESIPVWIENYKSNSNTPFIHKVIEKASWTGFGKYSSDNYKLKIYGNIKGFDCRENGEKIQSLNVEKNKNINLLYCQKNNINSLDLRQNDELLYLDCGGPELRYLNVANGNNGNILSFSAKNSPKLTCIQIDEGFTPPSSWKKDDAAEYTGGVCPPPDNAEFITMTVKKGQPIDISFFADNEDIGKRIWIEKSESIYDIKTIEKNGYTDYTFYATSSTAKLYSEYSFNKFNCKGNGENITGLSVATAPNLKKLQCADNQIETLDLSENKHLTYLDCKNNKLTYLNVAAVTNLKELECAGNQIEALDLSKNKHLTYLDCENNKLKSLNVANGNNGNISSFSAKNNTNLTCIQIDAGFTPPSSWEKDDAAEYSETACDNEGTDVENIQQNNVKIWTTNGQIHLQNLPIGKQVMLKDVLGREHFRANISNTNMQIPAFSGFYIIIIGNKATKIIVK